MSEPHPQTSKPGEPRVLVLVGPKGSGKSHLGRLLERELQIAFLDVEAVFRALPDPGDVVSGYERVARLAGTFLEESPRVSLEVTGASEHTSKFLQTLESLGHTLRLIRLQSPLDLCLERIAGRGAAGHLPTSDEIIRTVHERSTALTLGFDLTIDNVGLTDRELVDRVRTIL